MSRKTTSEITVQQFFAPNNIAKEFQRISDILDEYSHLYTEIASMMKIPMTNIGRKGMSVESAIRCAILKQYWRFSYGVLAFHLSDYETFHGFARLSPSFDPARSTLQSNISMLPAAAWEIINNAVIDTAAYLKLETGCQVRIDTTAVETNILHPSDSQLLYSGICAVVRNLDKSGDPYSDHTRASKKLLLQVRNSRGDKQRRNYYRKLIAYAKKTLGYALAVSSANLNKLCLQLSQVISQTHRRVILGESVPASEKIVSLHEEHTDIIRKGGRDTIYGHKITLATGKSGLVTTVDIYRGNPADSELLLSAINKLPTIPVQIAADDGFASKSNLEKVKELGVRDVALHKRRGLKVEDMCRSSFIYKRLIKFRAGVEANISFLKRVFGLDRCTWKGWEGFQSYVMASVVTYNLTLLSRQIQTL
ncbi:ISNCY family transposase [Deferribacteres bacterium DY0037]